MSVKRLVPALVFVAHALYVGACAASAPSGWTDFGISAQAAGPCGLGAYGRGQDYFVGFSYALGAAFATWALGQSIFFSSRKGCLGGSRREWGDAGRDAHGR
jgi:hypothetical protein